MKKKFSKCFFVLLFGAYLSLLLYSCGVKTIMKKSELDYPEHHFNNGMKLLDSQQFEDAHAEFSRAKELNSKYSPAYIGLALVSSFKDNYTEALKLIKLAEAYLKRDKQQNILLNISKMRIYTMGKNKISKKWLDYVEQEFNEAKNLDSKNPELFYYMGLAYKAALNLPKAIDQFRTVLDLNKNFIEEANKEYEDVQKMQRAGLGSKISKQISQINQITRADLAGLFIEELKLDQLFSKKSNKQFDTSYKAPNSEPSQDMQNLDNFDNFDSLDNLDIIDIENHELKTDIKLIIKLGVKGLEVYPDKTFRPDEKVSRAEFAMMIEDILIKITKDEKLGTKFIGGQSPFPDLRSDLPYFNAAMVCTTRGILSVKDKSTGEFDAKGTVSGSEALLSIRELKNQLKNY